MKPELAQIVNELIELGKKQNALTYRQIKKYLSAATLTAEENTEVYELLRKNNIEIISKTNRREWVESIVVAFLLAMIIRTFCLQAFRIPSGSMRPTLIEQDRLMVNKLRYGAKIPFTKKRLPGFQEPQRGDIVVFIHMPDNPQEKKRDFIKRLIAKGGETVEIRHGDIYINDRLVEKDVIKNITYYNRGDYGDFGKKVKVPEGNYFFLGDNSMSSYDSRFWGFVPKERIIGKAEFIYWPLTRMRFLK